MMSAAAQNGAGGGPPGPLVHPKDAFYGEAHYSCERLISGALLSIKSVSCSR